MSISVKLIPIILMGKCSQKALIIYLFVCLLRRPVALELADGALPCRPISVEQVLFPGEFGDVALLGNSSEEI